MIGMSTAWSQGVLELSRSVEPDIPRIRAVLDQLGIPNADYADPADYLPSAFINAAATGKALAFQTALVKAGLIKRGARRGPVDIERQLVDRLASLHAFSSPVFTPLDARVAARRLFLASDLVCRVDVDDTHGTGFLVAPTLVATAGHVVGELVEFDEERGVHVPVADSTSRITVTFGYATDLLDDQGAAPPPGTVVPLAEEWLAFYSPPTPHEIAGEGFVLDSVDGVSQRGPWDLAILRLAEAMPFRPMPPLRHMPTRPFQVNVLHHPDNGTGKVLPLQWSIGRVDRRLGEPPLRILHSANTSKGSSGAPVFDKEFRLVGLHQGGRLPEPGHDDESCNRAVPVLRWASMLDSLEFPDTLPEVETVQMTDANGGTVTRHVIGRHDTQERIWRSLSKVASPTDRLVAIIGEPGLGLRFTKYLVHALVTKFGGAYASIDVANCQGDDAVTFADKIAGAFAAKSRVRATSGLTTGQREVRNQTAPALSETLNAIAKHGGVWLVLEGFDCAASRPSAAVVDLVRQLIKELPRAPSVRLVLVGWQESLPSGFETNNEYLEEPSVDDIVRTLLPAKAPEVLVTLIRPHVEPKLTEARRLHPEASPYKLAENARAAASRDIAPLIDKLIKSLSGGERT